MIYTYQHVIDSVSDIVVVPVRCDEQIPEGSLHEKMVCLLPPGYMKRHFDAMRSSGMNQLTPGEPILYYIRDDAWAGRWVMNFPVEHAMGFDKFMAGVRKVLEVAKSMNVDEIAVQAEGWDTMWGTDCRETAWRWMEHQVLQDVYCQVSMHTMDQPDGVIEEDEEEFVDELFVEGQEVTVGV